MSRYMSRVDQAEAARQVREGVLWAVWRSSLETTRISSIREWSFEDFKVWFDNEACKESCLDEPRERAIHVGYFLIIFVFFYIFVFFDRFYIFLIFF